MPSIKDSAFGGFLFWPQLDAEARRELKALPTSKETPTEEEVLLDRYANQMCQRGVLGQVLVIMSPIFFVLLGLTQHPNFGWAALVALFGGLATFLKAAWDIAKQDDPDFKPPHDTVRRWDMNDWREGTWVIAVLMFFFLSACTWWILDSLLWFLMPIAPKKLQEISRSYGHTDDLADEQVRALFTTIAAMAAAFSAYERLLAATVVFLGIAVALTLLQHYETRRCTEDRIDPNKRPAC